MNEEFDQKIRLEKKRIEYEAMIQYFLVGVKGIILFNGGAAVALLTFWGHVIGKEETLSKLAGILRKYDCFLEQPIFWFMVGTGLGLLAALTVSSSQHQFVEEKPRRKYWKHSVTVLVILGLICFFSGGILAINQFNYIIQNI